MDAEASKESDLQFRGLLAQLGTKDALPPQPDRLDETLAGIGRQYPALAPHLPNVVVQRGAGGDGRFMEFYPPWETDNPNPNKTTLELYEPALKDPNLSSLMAGDMLHLLGSIDPRTNTPVDPTWLNLKRQLIGSMTPEQIEIDRRAYDRDRQQFGSASSFDDWMHDSRADAYIRGGVFPEANPDWQKPGTFTPQQQSIFNQMKSYLGGSGM